MAGAVWEVHTTKIGGSYNHPLSAWEPAWTQLGGARKFFESLPFAEMSALGDSLVQADKAFCLAQAGIAYACYLPVGGSVTLSLPAGNYAYSWWDPDNGYRDDFQHPGRINGGTRTFTAPGSGDFDSRPG